MLLEESLTPKEVFFTYAGDGRLFVTVFVVVVVDVVVVVAVVVVVDVVVGVFFLSQ